MVKLIYGNEPYLITQYKNKVLSELEMPELNYQSFTVFDDSVLAATNQLPFMDPRKIFIVNLEVLEKNNILENYLLDPSEFIDLFIIANAVDKRSKIYKLLLQQKNIMEFNKLDLVSLQEFITNYLAKHNESISNETMQYFINRINYHEDEFCTLYSVEIFLQQLIDYNHLIDKASIDLLIEKNLTENIFLISSYLFNKDAFKLFEMIELLINRKENAINILSLVLRNFRIAYKISISSTRDRKKLASEIGIQEYQLRLYNTIPTDIIDTCMDKIQNAVNEIKNGGISEIILKVTIGEILYIIP